MKATPVTHAGTALAARRRVVAGGGVTKIPASRSIGGADV